MPGNGPRVAQRVVVSRVRRVSMCRSFMVVGIRELQRRIVFGSAKCQVFA